MSEMGTLRRTCVKGFTLTESIIVLVVLAIASTGIVSMTTGIFSGQNENNDLQVGVKLLQECAEQVLQTRRRVDYSTALAVTCGNLQLFNDYPTAPAITPSTPTSGCPTGATCKLLTISLANNLRGVAPAPITLLLVK